MCRVKKGMEERGGKGRSMERKKKSYYRKLRRPRARRVGQKWNEKEATIMVRDW